MRAAPIPARSAAQAPICPGPARSVGRERSDPAPGLSAAVGGTCGGGGGGGGDSP